MVVVSALAWTSGLGKEKTPVQIVTDGKKDIFVLKEGTSCEEHLTGTG